MVEAASQEASKTASRPGALTRALVLEKCDFFVDTQIWPIENRLSPRSWLENFLPDEEELALRLLDSFVYFSNDLCDALLVGGASDLSRYYVSPDASYDHAAAQWADFRASVVVTYPTGEKPSATDSGYTFARKARQQLGIPEERILSPEETLGFLAKHGKRPVLFIDDFLGTGNQFIQTWIREYVVNGEVVTFASRAPSACYLPLVATTEGVATIAARAPGVRVSPAHTLPSLYGATHPESILWPPDSQESAVSALKAASTRAGIPDTDGQAVNDWQGFHKLGLCLAFEHSVPDATLPLFYWEENGWHPLIRRT